MPLPQRVQEQLDAADALLAQMGQPPQPDADAQPAVEPPQPAPAAADPVQDTPPTPAPTPQPPAPAPTTPQNHADWEHRFKSLQGRYNRLAQDSADRIGALEQQVKQFLQQRQEPPSQPEPVADTTKDAEVFGADLVEMVKRVAESMFGAVARQVDERLTAVERRLEGASQQVAKTGDEIFVERLRSQVPDYEAINVDDGFLAWLGEVDPVYGLPRQAALTEAANSRDVDRVAQIFLTYKRTLAPAQPPAQTPASELERQVAPRASAPAAPAPTGKPTFRASDVTKFYRDVQAGRYRGREQEAAAIEVQFNTALAEGRILEG